MLGTSLFSWFRLLLLSFTLLDATYGHGDEGHVDGKEIKFPWCIPYNSAFAVQNAKVGDTVIFEWDGVMPHNVILYPSGKCDDSTGSVFIGPDEGSTTASYTFTSEDVGAGCHVCL